ncbi:MAG: hypothetical protein RR547_14425 [Raoultibacter sp.]
MKRTTLIRIVTVALTGALCAVFLSGCMANNGQATEKNENREYMTQVNNAMNDLKTRLEGFDDAVSRNDLVAMRTQADSAFKALDTLGAIEAPEATKDIQTKYVDGTNDLKDALNLYIDLYTEIENATEAAPFDYSTYDSRLKDIKDAYDSGISSLEEGDKLAAEK